MYVCIMMDSDKPLSYENKVYKHLYYRAAGQNLTPGFNSLATYYWYKQPAGPLMSYDTWLIKVNVNGTAPIKIKVQYKGGKKKRNKNY
jgi:hypothetical protein